VEVNGRILTSHLDEFMAIREELLVANHGAGLRYRHRTGDSIAPPVHDRERKRATLAQAHDVSPRLRSAGFWSESAAAVQGYRQIPGTYSARASLPRFRLGLQWPL
jgi:hypothetical protein